MLVSRLGSQLIDVMTGVYRAVMPRHIDRGLVLMEGQGERDHGPFSHRSAPTPVSLKGNFC